MQIDLRFHTGGMDDRGNRQNDGSREESLGAAGDHLGDGDEPDRTWRLHPVFDLTGEPELLRQRHRDGLDALEHDGKTDNPGHEDRGEG